MKKIVLSLLFFLALPLGALADLSLNGEATSVSFAPIVVNPNVPVVGKEARVTITVYNRSTAEEQGLVQIYAGRGGVQIGSNLPVVVPQRGVDSVTVSWVPTVAGLYYINAYIDPTSANDDPTNNSFQMAVTVDADTDGDGMGNMEDQDDDNDGCWDYQDLEPLNPTVGCSTLPVEKTEDDASLDTSETSTNSTTTENVMITSGSSIVPLVGQMVEFSYDGELKEGNSVLWTFSDGTAMSGTTVRRDFQASGDYQVNRVVMKNGERPEAEVIKFRVAENDNFGFGWWWWLWILLLLILAGVIVYYYNKKQKEDLNETKKGLVRSRKF
jgi:hypothetical protein